MENFLPFNCTERCQAPDKFFYGGPLLDKPQDRILRLQKDETGLIEWQIWRRNSSGFNIEVDGIPIQKVKINGFNLPKVRSFH
jgi:hypothetical protein